MKAVGRYHRQLISSMLNLAEFESPSGDTAAASKLYRQMLAIGADFAPGHYACGLWLVRIGQPDVPRYAYVYGVAMNSSGLADEGLAALKKASSDSRQDYGIAWGLATMLRDNGDFNAARLLSQDMLARHADDENFSALLRSLPGAQLR